jgi:hypothetical protein
MSTVTAHRRPTRLVAAMLLAVLGLALPACGTATGAEPRPPTTRTVTFEAAEDPGRFVFANQPVLPSGLPAYGNGFVTQGFLYPTGTLTGSNGVIVEKHPNGTTTYRPEFPDKVIGTWTCYGYFIGKGADTTPADGPWVATTQIFEFTDGSVLTSLGTENVAGDEPARRALTGGAGQYARAEGQIEQLTLGHNAGDGVNAAFTVRLTDEIAKP